jgi:hypothetical protein
MTADFRQLLSTPMDEIKRPPPIPPGTYHGVVSSHEFRESSKKKTAYVQYNLALISPGEDVETSAFNDAVGVLELSKRNFNVSFYLTDQAKYRVKEFLESLGVQTTGRSLGECVPEALNARVLVTVTQQNSDDGKSVYNNVGDVKGEQE